VRSFRSVAMAFPLAVLVFASVGVLSPLSVAAAPCATSTSGGKTTVTFCFTGAAQTWKVPVGVTSVTFTVLGAAGGAGSGGGVHAGGLGGYALATRAVVPGSTITIVVGGQGAMPSCPGVTGGTGGFNGGGTGGGTAPGVCPGSGGGGASDVRIGGNRVVVAGGGGGASPDAAGGMGGGATGGNGAIAGGVITIGGKGGTQLAGGAGGSGGLAVTPGAAGSAGVGGAGGNSGGAAGRGGGGGGGGFFGGGGGGSEGDGPGGGGGGGSGHGPAGAVLAAGVRAGNGQVAITFTTPLPATSASQPSVPWLPIGGLAIGLALIGFGMRRRRRTAA
jgi:glycine rich protein